MAPSDTNNRATEPSASGSSSGDADMAQVSKVTTFFFFPFPILFLELSYICCSERTNKNVYGWYGTLCKLAPKHHRDARDDGRYIYSTIDLFIYRLLVLTAKQASQTMLFLFPNLNTIPQHAIPSFPVYSHSRKSRPGLPVERFIP